MILVVGGTGFIGKNLLAALHRAGRPGLTVSRAPDHEFLKAHAPTIDAMTIEAFHADPAAALFNCTGVVYLAGTSTPGSNLEAPWREAGDNVEPFLCFLNAVQLHGPRVHCVVMSSGGTVYGQVDGADTISEDTPLAPISAYGMGKSMMEVAAAFMAARYEMAITILRPANPVGPWQKSRSQGVVGVLLRAAASGAEFPMQGTGSAVRDYFDVADLCDAILMALDNPDKSVGKTYNVGSGDGRSVREIVDLVESVTGRSIAVQTVPARASDVDRVVLDTTRIRQELGWQPQRSLEETIGEIWSAQGVQ